MLPIHPFVRAAVAAACCLSLLAAQEAAGPRHTDRLLVCNKGAASLSIFDVATRAEVAVVPTGTGPHEVTVSADGRTAIVADYGDQKPGTTLTIVDVLRGERLRTVEVAREQDGERRLCPRPHGLAFAGADRVVVTSEATRRLVLFDPAAGLAARTWTTPQRTMHMVALSPDGARAFATSIHDGDLAVFDLGGDAPGPAAVVPCGAGAEGLAVDPVRGLVWVGNRDADTVSIVDPVQAKVIATLQTDAFPFRVAFAPSGEVALVSCAEGGTVQVFEPATRRLLHTIAIGGDGSEVSALPMGACVDPDGRFAYVSCGRGEFVAVLSLADGVLVDRIAARAGPDGIALARIVLDEPAGDGTVIR